MSPELAVAVVVALIVGGIVGHYMGKNPAAESAAIAAAKAELLKVRDVLESAAGKIHAAAQAQEVAAQAPIATAAAPEAALMVNPLPAPAPAVPWTLGDSYSNLGALAADIARPDFVRQVRIDGVPVFNVSGSDPADYYIVGAALTTTKP